MGLTLLSRLNIVAMSAAFLFVGAIIIGAF
ncbi:hypothetical protein GGR16_003072 [Chelatococcus caeni]|jgi:hypothetical protein|uniref:Uncharacterized protein n=1 Tax=Chelatococcus caeni TaxID=1348468 RepID=A0A840C306_9HYPH|nr:hypothetical protein [Chelatococcus caeni]